MNTIKHITVSSLIAAFVVSSHLGVLQSPVYAGFFNNAVNSIKKEVNNCTHGGCDPTRTTPQDVLKTTTGARAVGAATNRWMNRQVRINKAKANDMKNRLKKSIEENLKCVEFPSMEGVCTELNQYYGLNMQIQRFSWEQLVAGYSAENVQFVRNCVNQKNLPFKSPSSWSCLPYSQYIE